MVMYGAIIGDVAGSYLEVLEIKEYRNKSKRSYEDRIKIMDKNVPLFDDNSSYTDDTVLTVAIADAIMNGKSYEDALKEYASEEIKLKEDKYGRSRFSIGFTKWVKGEKDGDSIGNGSAMRVSPVSFLFDDIDTVYEQATYSAMPSHNSYYGISGAQDAATAIFLARKGFAKEEIKRYLESSLLMYLDYDLEKLRRTNVFAATASETVDKAIFCFLRSTSFEDAIRIALSIGGDTDTIASIAGAIAEAYYGVPEVLIEKVKPYIPDKFMRIINDFYKKSSVLKLNK